MFLFVDYSCLSKQLFVLECIQADDEPLLLFSNPSGGLFCEYEITFLIGSWIMDGN